MKLTEIVAQNTIFLINLGDLIKTKMNETIFSLEI